MIVGKSESFFYGTIIASSNYHQSVESSPCASLTAALLALIATLAGTAAAKAGVFPVNVLFANFNLIADQDIAPTSEVIGPVLIGGNLSGHGMLDTTGTVSSGGGHLVHRLWRNQRFRQQFWKLDRDPQRRLCRRRKNTRQLPAQARLPRITPFRGTINPARGPTL